MDTASDLTSGTEASRLDTTQGGWSPEPSRPRVAPLDASDEFWFGATRLFPRSQRYGPPAIDVPAAKIARGLSRHAADLTAMDDETAENAAWMHAEAAERKRIAGIPGEAFVDYEALCLHYLAKSRLKPAIAYMRKALHVSELSGEAKAQVLALRLAAEVRRAAGETERALGIARRAHEVAKAAGLADMAVDPVKLLLESVFRKNTFCKCATTDKYLTCCGAADVPPVEYSAEMPGSFDKGPPTPFRRSGRTAVETLMRPPAGAERSTWYVWRVEDGCYRLDTYANWSGRALRAAEAMARIADGPDLAEATSSAVLQSFIALQSFLTSWKTHMRRDTGNRHWPTPMGDDRNDKGDHGDGGSNFLPNWDSAARATIGEYWQLPDPDGFRALARIRNSLCHHVAATATVIPDNLEDQDRQVIAYLISRGIKVGHGPAPMIDRIMVAGVAAWAVEVAKLQISAVQKAWNLAADEADPDERWSAEDAEEIHDDFDPSEGHVGEPAAPWADSARAVVRAGTGLRGIARRRVIGTMADTAND